MQDRQISIHALLAESDRTATNRRPIFFGFLSTLSLRRATEKVPADVYYQAFLSTLSLRRATAALSQVVSPKLYFYPRSPCGERRQIKQTCRVKTSISIHALLAESDIFPPVDTSSVKISIHALLAESDRRRARESIGTLHFYPRSPCGERLEHLLII